MKGKVWNTFHLKLLSLWQKGAFHIIIGNFITKFVALFGSIFLVRVLSKESYGILAYIENIYGYVIIFAGMGLANSVLRFVVTSKNIEEEYGFYRYAVNKGSKINVVLVILAAIIIFLCPIHYKYSNIKVLLIIIMITLPFQYVTDVNIFMLRAKFDNKRYAILSFIVSTSLVIFRFFGAKFGDVNGVVFAIVSTSLLFSVISINYIYNLYFRNIKPIIMSNDIKKKVDSFSFQYMITNGIWILFMLNDIFLLGLFNGDPQILAEYKVSYVIPGNIIILSSAIGIFISPYFVKNENDYSWIRVNYLKVIGINSVLIGLTVLILMIFAKQIVTVLFGPSYTNVVSLMRLLLIIAFVNSGLRYTTANLLAAMGQIKYNMAISIIGLLMQLTINVIMIPLFGVVGLIFTNLAIYIGMTIALMIIFFNKYMKVMNG